MAETDGYVLRAYDTEANARVGGATGRLDIDSTTNEEGSILNNVSQAAGYHFFTFQRYWYRIEANEPVSEFYIDWDDGEDNSPKKANVSIIKTDKPSFYGITSHIYTQSKKFYPLIRVKSIDGFLSKWYTPHSSDGANASNNTFAGIDDDIKTTATSGLADDRGQNSFSVVSMENSDDTNTMARIPVFEPANVPPVGVLKVDRKRVFSGIDNDRLGNNSRMIDQSSAELPYTSVVHAHCSNSSRTGIQVKVTYQEGVTGGVKSVSSIQIKAGTGTSGRTVSFNNHDLDDCVIKIKTMDEYYWCWWNVDSRQPNGTSIPGFDSDDHTAVIAAPAVESTGAAGEVLTTNLVSSMVAAINAVVFPVTSPASGRTEFTASGTADGGTEIITITNNRAGKVGTHVEISQVVDGGGTTPPMVAPFDATYGNASPANGVNTTTAGLSASDGIIKQATLTTTSAYHANSKLINVGEILKAELVNNLENTDSYGGSSGTTTLAAGERVYIMSALNTSAADTAPTSAMRANNPNLSNTICSVSLGNPVVELNSIGTKITADATESKIRCSNKSVSNYYIDDNKLMSGDTTGNLAAHMADSTYNVTPKMVNGADFKSTYGTKDLRYAFDWWREHQDNNHRFYSQKRLLRCQVEDNHTQATDDGYNRSPLIHYDFTRYEGIGVQAANQQPSEIEKWNYGAFIGTQKAKLRTPQWLDLQGGHSSDRTVLFGAGPAGAGLSLQLLASTDFDNLTTQAHYQPDNVADAAGLTDNGGVGPRNAFFMANKIKYDRIFFRVSHDRFNAQSQDPANGNNIENNVTPFTSQNCPKIRLQILYPAKKTKNSSTIVWKPLPIIDRTKLQDKDDSTFYRSGEIIFNPPADWEKTYHAAHNLTSGDTQDTNIVYPFEDNFYDDATGATGISDVWDHSSYALILVVTEIQSSAAEERLRSIFNIMHAYPYNNSHSQLIEIVDPMHVSLNSYGIAQTVAFVRKGSFQEIKDRSGISQMRRIGAQGGNIKLGGIDLKSDAKTTRAKFDEFVKDAVPLYYDVTHEDDSITRLFGVMTEMSEDHPTAKVIPKFACTMTITHILEIDSSGNIKGSGYKPLGGDVLDVEQYLSAS